MNRVAVLPSCLAALLLAASPAFAASAADSSATTAPAAPAAPAQPGAPTAGLHDPAMIQWQPVPPLLPQGAQIAVDDKEQLDSVYATVQHRLNEAGPFFPLFQPAQVAVAASWVKGIEFSATTFVDLAQLKHD